MAIALRWRSHETVIHLLRFTGVCWWFVGVVYIYCGCHAGLTLTLTSASFIFSREPRKCWGLFYTLQIVPHGIEGKHCHPYGPQPHLHWSLNIQFQYAGPVSGVQTTDEYMLNLGRISISKGRCSGYSVATIYFDHFEASVLPYHRPT